MKDDNIYYKAMGSIKELTKQINIRLEEPSGTSIEEIIEMGKTIIDISKKYDIDIRKFKKKGDD